MVNRVDGNDYYDYTKLKLPDAADKTGTGEKFSLNYQLPQEDDAEKDEKDGNEEAEGVKGKRPRTVLQGGVRLELSRNAAQTVSGQPHGKTEQLQDSGQNLVNTVLSWLHAVIQAIKDIANKIWNDPIPQDEVSQEPIKAEDENAQETQAPERLTEEYLALHDLEHLHNAEETVRHPQQREADRDKEIRKYLRSGNLEQVISLVTDNGHKTMAKNSTLLTYYDRNGKITSLSASDQERILHGDRNVKKL